MPTNFTVLPVDDEGAPEQGTSVVVENDPGELPTGECEQVVEKSMWLNAH